MESEGDRGREREIEICLNRHKNIALDFDSSGVLNCRSQSASPIYRMMPIYARDKG